MVEEAVGAYLDSVAEGLVPVAWVAQSRAFQVLRQRARQGALQGDAEDDVGVEAAVADSEEAETGGAGDDPDLLMAFLHSQMPNAAHLKRLAQQRPPNDKWAREVLSYDAADLVAHPGWLAFAEGLCTCMGRADSEAQDDSAKALGGMLSNGTPQQCTEVYLALLGECRRHRVQVPLVLLRCVARELNRETSRLFSQPSSVVATAMRETLELLLLNWPRFVNLNESSSHWLQRLLRTARSPAALCPILLESGFAHFVVQSACSLSSSAPAAVALVCAMVASPHARALVLPSCPEWMDGTLVRALADSPVSTRSNLALDSLTMATDAVPQATCLAHHLLAKGDAAATEWLFKLSSRRPDAAALVNDADLAALATKTNNDDLLCAVLARHASAADIRLQVDSDTLARLVNTGRVEPLTHIDNCRRLSALSKPISFKLAFEPPTATVDPLQLCAFQNLMSAAEEDTALRQLIADNGLPTRISAAKRRNAPWAVAYSTPKQS